MTNKLNGYHLVHLQHGKDLVVNYVDDVAYGANIDGIDPASYKTPIFIVSSQIVAIEPLSVERLNYIREMTLRRLRTTDIQSILQLKEAIDVGQRAGVVSINPNEEQPQLEPEQPHQNEIKQAAAKKQAENKQPKKQAAPKANAPVVADNNNEKPVEVRSPRMLGSDAGFSANDGRVVTIPKPGIQ